MRLIFFCRSKHLNSTFCVCPTLPVYDFIESQAASGMILHNHRRLPAHAPAFKKIFISWHNPCKYHNSTPRSYKVPRFLVVSRLKFYRVRGVICVASNSTNTVLEKSPKKLEKGSQLLVRLSLKWLLLESKSLNDKGSNLRKWFILELASSSTIKFPPPPHQPCW